MIRWRAARDAGDEARAREDALVTRHGTRFRHAPLVGAAGQQAMLAMLAATTGLGAAGWLAGSLYAAAVCAGLTAALRRSGAGSLGPADHVTLARAMLTGCVAALVADPAGRSAPAPLAVLAAIALLLDAVDGRVARRTGTASPLGARFDMEIDASLILLLSVFAAGSLGWWVTAIGGMRYVFFAASGPLRWLRASLPPNMARKTIAGLQGTVLTVVASGVLPRPAAEALTAAALAALVWSFGRDVVRLHLLRQERHRPGTEPYPARAEPAGGTVGPRDSAVIPRPGAGSRHAGTAPAAVPAPARGATAVRGGGGRPGPAVTSPAVR